MYTDILRRLGDAVRRKYPEKLRTNIWFLLHDNALTQLSVLVKDFLAKKKVTSLEQPPPPLILVTWLQLKFICSLK